MPTPGSSLPLDCGAPGVRLVSARKRLPGGLALAYGAMARGSAGQCRFGRSRR